MSIESVKAVLEADFEAVVKFFHDLFEKSSAPVAPVAPVEVAAAPSPVVEAPATPTTGTSNWLTGDIAGQAPAAPVVAPVGPADDDTQRPESLDNSFAQMNNVFVGSKTLTGPGKVEVKFNITSKLGGTQFPTVIKVGEQSWTMNFPSFDPVVVDTPVVVSASTPVVMQFRPE